ncbi:MAG: DNA polymerase/3'-5' exonuclease PolX [Candidatus Magasanikbacteria bacterium]|nr:DNA polymerase/3'-5' exonuclease PolX [Candidatus Magasanikbacteria bacterium]
MNSEIAKIFNHMAFILEGLNVLFKPRAYAQAAEAILAWNKDVEEIYKSEGLTGLKQIPSIGQNLAEHIEEIIKTGRLKEYEKLKKKLPVDIEGLSAIEGLGPKKMKILYDKLKIKTVADLAKAIATHKIAKLEHFGAQSETNIQRGLKFLKTNTGRIPLGYILPLAREIEQKLSKTPGVKKVIIAGSIRRWQETIGDIDILAISDQPKKIMEAFVSLPEIQTILSHGPTRSSVRLKIGLDADLRAVAPKSFGAALQYFTGDKNHNVKIREIAIKKGLKLNEYGLWRKEKNIACQTEEKIYAALGLDYIEPELRTDSGEIFAAQKHQLPRLIPHGSLKGDLQIQTNWTDGECTIEALARAAMEAGLEYIAITDHTKTLGIAHGLDEKQLAKQGQKIDALNVKFIKEKINFKILKSAEININKDGSLDIADAALKKLDIMSVAIHSAFRLSKNEQTKRIIRAIEHSLVNILFHPTGRLINRREPYELDLEAIIKAAAANRVALELDCFPDRMDLKDTYVRQVIARGVKIAIDTDAHHPEHFKFLELGIGTARRGWAAKNDVINTWPIKKLLKWARK